MLRRFLGRSRLSRTFTLANVAILSVLALAVTLVAMQTHDRAGETLMERQWRLSAAVTADALQSALAQDEASADEYVSRLGRQSDVRSVVLYRLEDSGDLVPTCGHTEGRGLEPGGVMADALARECVASRSTLFVLDEDATDGERLAHVAFPLRSEDGLWGVGRLDVSAAHLDALGQSLAERIGLICLAFLLFGVVAGSALARYIVGPVKRLTDVAMRVSSGDLDVSVALHRDDEVGDLGRSFDGMITSLRTARGDLERARSFVEDVYASMVDALVVVEPAAGDRNWNGPLRIRSVNRAACELVGIDEAELVGIDLESIIGRTDFRERIAAAVRTGTPISDLKTAALCRDGTNTPVSVTATPLMGRDVEVPDCEIHIGTTCDCVAPPAAMVLVARDLTAIRRAERTRRASYEVVSASQHAPTLDALYESVHGVLVSMMTTDHFAIALRDRHDGRLLGAYSDDPHREQNEVTTGLIPHAMKHTGPTHLKREQIEALVAAEEVELEGDVPEEWLGIPLRTNDETIGLLALASRTPGSGFSDDDVKLAAFICEQVARAIGSRRKAEERARLSSAVEHAADAIVLTDATRAVEYMNVAFQRLSGWSEEDVRGRDLLSLGATKEDVAARQQIWMVVEREGAWSGRMQSRRKDGSLYESDVSISSVRDEDGHVIHYVCVEHDVTNEVALEAQLRQAQKMEAVGKLAGGVAHDFNNLLSVINGYASILLASSDAESPEHDHVEEILRAGERAAGLTRQLLAFSRRQVLKPRVLELNSVVRDMEKMLRRLIGEDVDLHTVLDDSVGTVEADPGQLEQVVMNLAVNARDAMLRGGRLTIETGQRYLGDEYCAHHAELQPGHYVLLAITDSGHGMSPATAARIFEPFFTTKETGKGTGLGLSTVYGIVKQSGGHISVYSEVGRGTCFRIYLPRVGQGEVDEVDEVDAEPVPTGQETVLVAEDEDGVRKLAALLLKRQGYNVLQAEDGESALRVAAQHDGLIHLLLTDVVMPRMSGRELWDVLSQEREETRVLYMSGYTDTAIVHHGVLDPGTPFIEKPFVPDELLNLIRQVLDGEHAALRTA